MRSTGGWDCLRCGNTIKGMPEQKEGSASSCTCSIEPAPSCAASASARATAVMASAETQQQGTLAVGCAGES
eukprot:scaffold233864_cov27-Tisochrysis_lutea.AAC.2